MVGVYMLIYILRGVQLALLHERPSILGLPPTYPKIAYPYRR
jgi:hypothetical protein